MMNKHFAPLLALALPTAFVVAACGDDDTDTPMDMGQGPADMGMSDMGQGPVDIVATAQAAGLDSLLTAATTAGLADTLATGGPFTVFAPTDAAFTDLGSAVPTDPGLLANVLLHHVVSGTNDSAAVTGATSFTTLANTSIAVDAAATPPTIGGAALSATLDVAASNGIVHVLDAVMVPPTIPEAVVATEDLSTLETAVGASSQTTQDALAGGPITVFAPVNSAFAGIDLNSLSQEDVDRILTYHVVPSQVLSTELMDGQMVTTAQGQTFTVNVTGSGVTLTDAMNNVVNVVTTDIRLLNGTVHLIDGVLMPAADGPGNIVETAQTAGLSTLLSAATTAGLADTLATGGPFTVFAPTDTAFTNLGAAVPSDAGLLANVLLHHVVSGINDSTAVTGAMSFTTLANTTIPVDAMAGTIGGAALSMTLDVMASNGIVHVLDAVMVPPTIPQAVAATDDLSTLEIAVGASSASTQNALAGGPITVFAPVNSAFAGIDLNMLTQAQVDSILTYHVVPSQVLSTDLTDGQVVTTAQGGTFTVNIAGNAVTLTDAMNNVINVTATDIRLLNGTVHLIDGVLMP
ncbi:MAG: fasciclin domain-containing protein [Myxococcota bacterium]